MQTLPGKPEYIDGISYWIADPQVLQTLQQRLTQVPGAESKN